MNVKELKSRLALLKDRDDNLEVAIPIEKKGVLLGVSPHVKVTQVMRGFDWNPHLFFVYPESKLSEYHEKEFNPDYLDFKSGVRAGKSLLLKDLQPYADVHIDLYNKFISLREELDS